VRKRLESCSPLGKGTVATSASAFSLRWRGSRGDRRTVRNLGRRQAALLPRHQSVAIASAEFLKSRNPNSNIAVKDLRTGEVTPVAFRPQRA
jgi:hypothetical protein